MIKHILFFVLLVLPVSVDGQLLQDSTKCNYTLFHSCPKAQMRSFETDRPDATESPYTLDAGHFQFETDLFKTDRSSVGGVKTKENSFNVFNLKAGLTNLLDIQFIAASFVDTRFISGSSQETRTSFNSITIRAKQNIWGNDRGKTAMAILPFVNFPTGSDTKITGGLVLPISISLSYDWDFGTQIEMDFEENQNSGGYHINPLVSSTFAHQLINNFDFFVEGLISGESELKSYEYFINSGLVYNWKEYLKLDTGFYYGLKSNSSKVYFIGLSFRY